jgi:hypothetical protein
MSDKTQFERSTVATPYFDGNRHGTTIDRGIGADVSRGPSGGYVAPDKLKSNLVKPSLANR